MSSLEDRLSILEKTVSTIETATPRNSSTVSRGELSVVGQGDIVVESGGTLEFLVGGSVRSDDFDISSGTGWSIGTERRGSAVTALHSVSGVSTVKSASSDTRFSSYVVDDEMTIELDEFSSMIVQIYHINEFSVDLEVNGQKLYPTEVIHSAKVAYVYTYMDHVVGPVVVNTESDNITVNVLRLLVNNVT